MSNYEEQIQDLEKRVDQLRKHLAATTMHLHAAVARIELAIKDDEPGVVLHAWAPGARRALDAAVLWLAPPSLSVSPGLDEACERLGEALEHAELAASRCNAEGVTA